MLHLVGVLWGLAQVYLYLFGLLLCDDIIIAVVLRLFIVYIYYLKEIPLNIYEKLLVQVP